MGCANWRPAFRGGLHVPSSSRSSAVVLLGLPSQAGAQTTTSVEPFNLATVDIAGREAVALVLREQHVVELDGANRNLEMTGNYPAVAVPDNMLDLIGQYQVRIEEPRLRNRQPRGGQRATHGHPAAGLRPQRGGRPFPRADQVSGQDAERRGQFLQPLLRGVPRRGAGRRPTKRMADRGVPYLFYKTTRGGIIGHNDEIVIPDGRDRVDWEVELGVVIGRTARYVRRARPGTTCSGTRFTTTCPTAATVRRAASVSSWTGS